LLQHLNYSYRKAFNVLREQSPLQINTYVLTFVIDEVEVFTGSVKYFSRKMHKAPEITGQN
jgi:hypothetical protein